MRWASRDLTATTTTPAERPRIVEIRHTWREVLDVFRDRESLEEQYGQCWPACAQHDCGARLHDDGWHVRPGAPADAHEHQPSHRPGQLDADLARLADQVWDDSDSSILIRVLIHELSGPGEIEDLFIVLNRNDLIEAQSLPIAGRETAWAHGSAGEFPPHMLDRLIGAAGDLWHSTGGHDPHDVLSAPQREVLDQAAAVHQAALNREMGAGRDLPDHGETADDLTRADIENTTWPAGTFFRPVYRQRLGTCQTCLRRDAYGTGPNGRPICDECGNV
jgi:hypothetical protein